MTDHGVRAAGRGWAYFGATIGVLVSIGANVGHCFVPPDGADAGWQPKPGAIAFSVFWPVALFTVLEILARTPWPVRRASTVVRWLGFPPVGLSAAYVSYQHLSGLLDWLGEDAVVSTIGPLAVDGLMLIASGALLLTTAPVTPGTVSDGGVAVAVLDGKVASLEADVAVLDNEQKLLTMAVSGVLGDAQEDACDGAVAGPSPASPGASQQPIDLQEYASQRRPHQPDWDTAQKVYCDLLEEGRELTNDEVLLMLHGTSQVSPADREKARKARYRWKVRHQADDAQGDAIGDA